MAYNLFLDDERLPEDVTWISNFPEYTTFMWDIVRNYDQFKAIVDWFGVPDLISFDHDLADEHYQVMLKEVESFTYNDGDLTKTFDYGSEKTGFDCAKYLVDYCHDNNIVFPEYIVHSMNPVGKQRIEQYIKNAINVGFIKVRTY